MHLLILVQHLYRSLLVVPKKLDVYELWKIQSYVLFPLPATEAISILWVWGFSLFQWGNIKTVQAAL